jgi:hypothetical protein
MHTFHTLEKWPMRIDFRNPSAGESEQVENEQVEREQVEKEQISKRSCYGASGPLIRAGD